MAAADVIAPRADPWILVIENERHVEPTFEHRAEHGRICRIDGDEERVERPHALKRPRSAAKAGQRTQPKVADADGACQANGQRSRTDDLDRGRYELAELGIDPSFVIVLGDR